jgi:2-oxoglutarate dehydrogenase E1 component
MAPSLRELSASTPLSGGNAPYVEALYEQFLSDPQSVDPAWRDYFARLQDGLKQRDGAGAEQIHSTVQAGIVQRASKPRMATGSSGTLSTDAAAKQGSVSRLVQIYANRGHLIANLDPLGLEKRERPRVLELGYFGLTDADLDTEFLTGSRPSDLAPRLKLREIIAQLEYAYCGTIGAEFAHVSNTEERLWLQDQYLVGRLRGKLSVDEQKNILWQLSAAEGLERYLHTKYVGQ